MQAHGRASSAAQNGRPAVTDSAVRKRQLAAADEQRAQKRGCSIDRPVLSELAPGQNQQQAGRPQSRVVWLLDGEEVARWSAGVLRATAQLSTALAEWPQEAAQEAAEEAGSCFSSRVAPDVPQDTMDWDSVLLPAASCQGGRASAEARDAAALSAGAAVSSARRSFFFREFRRCSHLLRARANSDAGSSSGSADMEL